MKDNQSPVFELAERTRQFQLVLDNVELPIWYSDRDLVYRVVNRPYAQMFGVDEAQIIGLRVPDVIGAELFGHVEEHVVRVLNGERVTYEREAQWRGRGRRRVRVTLFPDSRPSGEID